MALLLAVMPSLFSISIRDHLCRRKQPNAINVSVPTNPVAPGIQNFHGVALHIAASGQIVRGNEFTMLSAIRGDG